MKINRKLEIAINALSALKGQIAPMNCKELAVAAGTTLHFIEQVMGNLSKAGLVVVQRGPGGGYNLNTVYGPISTADVSCAIGRKLKSGSCESAASRLERAIEEAYANTIV